MEGLAYLEGPMLMRLNFFLNLIFILFYFIIFTGRTLTLLTNTLRK